MPSLIDPTSAAFLYAESRSMPMHVGGLQLYKKPEGAGRTYTQDLYQQWREHEDISPLFLKHPVRSLSSGGIYRWEHDELFDIDHHVRHSALPKPGRVRELLDLVSRLHGSRLAYERPLWEFHLIEGLRDGRVAMYTKIHHGLVDGVASMKLLRSILSDDPDRRDMPPPWARRPRAPRPKSDQGASVGLAEIPGDVLRSALAISADAGGLPGALVKTIARGARHEASPVSLRAPRTLLNEPITGARRFAAQSWDMERMRAIGRASGVTLNDVVLAMCGGALRTYLADLGGLPGESLISMVPVSLHAKTHDADPTGGNAVGAVMVPLATDVADAGVRLHRIHESMVSGKAAMSQMTPLQVMAMSAVGMSPVLLNPLLKATGYGRPPFNLIISNVPGPTERQYLNGAEMVGMYPLSIPFHGNALNITCTSYADQLSFGLTGCRRTVPHLQRLLTHLDTELRALERAAGV